MGRAFGLLSDHVEGFKIVLAAGKYLSVWAPNRKEITAFSTKEKKLNDDLYWAVLGGSPGNFGILTHVWLRPHKDDDHPDSRGFRNLNIYSKEKLENVLRVVAEMNDDQNLPRDFDICCTVMSNAYCSIVDYIGQHKNYDEDYLDEKMRRKYKEEYADGVDEYIEAGENKSPEHGTPFPVILVYMQWANVDGKTKFGEEEQKMFNKLKEALESGNDSEEDKKIIKFLRLVLKSQKWQLVSEEEHTKISDLTRYWCYEDVREFVQPYEKRVYVTERKDLSQKDDVLQKDWPTWASERIDEIMTDDDEKMNLVVQIQPFGGKNSMFYQNGDPSNQKTHGVHGCHSWRQELSLVQVFDFFYKPVKEFLHDPENDTNLQVGLAWQAENDKSAGPGGFFSKYDRRLLWGSYARLTDPDHGASLDLLHDRYFDTEEKYNDLVAIKKNVDSKHIFTPNLFAVGANCAPKGRQLEIIGRGHEAAAQKLKETAK